MKTKIVVVSLPMKGYLPTDKISNPIQNDSFHLADLNDRTQVNVFLAPTMSVPPNNPDVTIGIKKSG